MVSARYTSLKSALRNWRRTSYLLLGTILSVSFLVGAFLATDSSMSSMLDRTAAGAPVDAILQRPDAREFNETQLNATVSFLESLSTVEGVASLHSLGQLTFWHEGLSYIPGVLAFLPRNGSEIVEACGIEGRLPDSGTAAIDAWMADYLNVAVGEAVVAEYWWFGDDGTGQTVRRTVNLSLTVSEIWWQKAVGQKPSGWSGDESGLVLSETIVVGTQQDPIFVNLADAIVLLDQISRASGFSTPVYPEYLIWLNRGEITKEGSIERALARLDAVLGELQEVSAPYGLYVVSSPLRDSLSGLGHDFSELKTKYVVFTLPVTVLGMYLSMVGVELSYGSRRREVAIIKSRGGSNGQILVAVLLESLLLGGVAGVCGLILGAFESRLLLSTSTGFLGVDARIDWGQLDVEPMSVLVSVALGVTLMAISYCRLIVRATRLRVAEGLHQYVPSEAKIRYDPRLDIISLALVVICAVSILVHEEAIVDGVDSSIVEESLLTARSIGVSLLPAIPLLLSLSSIRLMTRYRWPIFVRFAGLFTSFTREVHDLVVRSIQRNIRRSSTLTMVISLSIAFAVFASSVGESDWAYRLDQVRHEIGADINAFSNVPNGPDYHGRQLNLTHLNEVGAYSEVEHRCLYYSVNAEMLDMSGKVAVFDIADYWETARPEDFWFLHTRDSAETRLMKNGTAFVRQDVAEYGAVSVGDRVQIELRYWNSVDVSYVTVPLELLVVDIVKSIPGLGANMVFINRDTVAFLSDMQLSEMTMANVGVLLDMRPGVYPGAMEIQVERIFEESGLNPSVMSVEIEKMRLETNPSSTVLRQFLIYEYAVFLLIASVGVGMMALIAISERNQELASIQVRGCSRPQLVRMLVGESLVLSTLGFLIGIATGLLASYLFNELSAEVLDQFGKRYVVTTNTFLICIVALVSFITASTLAAWGSSRIGLAKALRQRGG